MSNVGISPTHTYKVVATLIGTLKGYKFYSLMSFPKATLVEKN